MQKNLGQAAIKRKNVPAVTTVLLVKHRDIRMEFIAAQHSEL